MADNIYGHYRSTPCPEKGATLFFPITLPHPYIPIFKILLPSHSAVNLT